MSRVSLARVSTESWSRSSSSRHCFSAVAAPAASSCPQKLNGIYWWLGRRYLCGYYAAAGIQSLITVWLNHVGWCINFRAVIKCFVGVDTLKCIGNHVTRVIIEIQGWEHYYIYKNIFWELIIRHDHVYFFLKSSLNIIIYDKSWYYQSFRVLLMTLFVKNNN